MISLRQLIFLSMVAYSSLPTASPPSTGVAVTQAATEAGRVGGSVDGDVVSWKGIPFAAPPVGALRWRAPQPPAPWQGTLATTSFRSDCMQGRFVGDPSPSTSLPAEDCLYANVWRPARSAKLPVLVWIYGGGFLNGGTSPPVYGGANLARQGLLVVSFNYRLGRFGTFAHSRLTKENADGGLLGNYGYMDQLAAPPRTSTSGTPRFRSRETGRQPYSGDPRQR